VAVQKSYPTAWDPLTNTVATVMMQIVHDRTKM
jgi:hypothetical protein